MTKIFVAFPVRGKFLDDLIAISAANPIKGIRWTKKDNMHVTLFFIGEVEEKYISKILSVLTGFFKSQSPFNLKFSSIEVKSNKKGPVMIWAQLEKNKLYAQLSDNIYKLVKSFMAIDPTHKDPVPHITLARIKWHAKLETLNLTFEPTQPIVMNVDSAELWKSVETEEGVRYDSLGKLPML